MVFTFSILTTIKSECPGDSLLAPCSCKGDEQITCTGDKPFCDVFKGLAKKVDDKHKDYEMFILSDSGVKELPENCFDDIYFKEIRIERAVGLNKIHSNAFKGTDVLTQRIIIKNCPNIDTSNLFEILNKFKKLDAITLVDIGSNKIDLARILPNFSIPRAKGNTQQWFGASRGARLAIDRGTDCPEVGGKGFSQTQLIDGNTYNEHFFD